MPVNQSIHSSRSSILTEWNAIHERAPAAVAVRDRERTLTYQTLECESDLWNRCLSDPSRVGPVVVHASNGCLLAGAILGSLKAGRLCVPLAKNTPAERVQQLVEFSGAESLISDDSEILGKASGWSTSLEILDDSSLQTFEARRWDLERPEASFRSCCAQTPAFLMFTSGTEGRPKPVILCHRNIVRECNHFRKSLGLRQDDRASWFHASSVLAGLRELLMPLLTGCSVNAFNYAESGAVEMASWLNRERITVCRFVPSMFRQFCSLLGPGDTFPNVRVFYIGGERVLPGDVDLFRQHFPNARKFSIVYGSTETGLCLENAIPAEGALISSDSLALGRPVPGYQLRIASPDEDLSGELVVSGECLNVAVPDDGHSIVPFSVAESSGNHEHYSGDHVRTDERGLWYFVSRKRDFVKIGGNRVQST